MKIIPEIKSLTREHHTSLTLANQCINTAKLKTAKEQNSLYDEISKTFESDFHNHFLIEETFIFQPLIEQDTPLKEVVLQLKSEHKILLNQSKNINNNKDLIEFGTLLKEHTRLEDREVFPQLTQYLSTEQLQKIQQNYD
jgi:hemerythrin-like domain-containing protein